MESIEGWVKISRQMIGWEWYSDSVVKSVMLHFILNANFKPTRYRGYDIGVGSLVCRTEETAHELGISVQQFRTAVDKLTRTGEITKNSTNKFTIINVCKYESYQLEHKSRQQQATNKQQTNNKQNNKQITNKNTNVNDYECGSYMLENESEQQANNKQITNKQQTNNKQCLFIINREERKKERKKECYYDDDEKEKKEKVVVDEEKQPLKIFEEKNIPSENGRAARAGVNFSLPTFIPTEEVGAWLVKETSTEWKETVCRQLGCSMEDLPWMYSQYVDELHLQGIVQKDTRDIQRHFVNLMRVKIKQAKNEREEKKVGEFSPAVMKLMDMYCRKD